MGKLNAYVKDLFYKTKLVGVLDFFLFQLTRIRNKKRNADFIKRNPSLIIPPDYFLYETFRLDYELFYKDGEITAGEIIDWTKEYILNKNPNILDWGCGASRIISHIPKFAPPAALLYACDINEEMIAFNKKNFSNITYSLIDYLPPTSYKDDYFDLIYGVSIFTHIELGLQESWFKEMKRILKVNGIFLFTTQGSFFTSKLLKEEMNLFNKNGGFTKSYQQKGHRMMSTYNSASSLIKLLEKDFVVVEFHDGNADGTKSGGQDLWIIKKKPNSQFSTFPAI